jgi:vitamin B12 transporter
MATERLEHALGKAMAFVPPARIPANTVVVRASHSRDVHALSGKTARALVDGSSFMKTRFFRARYGAVAASCALIFPFSVSAQDGAGTVALQEVVVTASRSQQLLVDAIPSTTVIGRDAIERSQAIDLPSLLASEASFQFTQNGGRGSASNVFLRGASGMQVLVLVDGVPMTRQDTTGTVGIEHMMLDQIDHVEIVRGNVSAIYGSGAIGGVIQIFTRDPSGKPLAYAQIEAGSFGTTKSSGGIGGAYGDTHYILGFGRTSTDGFTAMSQTKYPLENPDADGYSNSNFNLGISHDISTEHRVGLRIQGSEGILNFDGGTYGVATDGYKGVNNLQSWQLYTRDQITSDWRSDFSYSESREYAYADLTNNDYPWISQALTQSKTGNWNNVYVLDDWTLNAGVENQNQSIVTSYLYSSSSAYDTLDNLTKYRDLTSGFVGASGSFGKHSLQANARVDSVSGGSGNDTHYLGYGFQWSPAWKLLASTSTAFNLPPLGYLYDPTSGNASLQPETAMSNEWGVQWTEARQLVRVTNFNTRTKNLLQYDSSTYLFGNVDNALNTGTEIMYAGKVSDAALHGSYTRQYPIDETTGVLLARRAQVMGSIGFSLPRGPWTVGADWRYTGERTDPKGQLDAYAVLDLKLRYALSTELTATARIDNVFDTEYQTAYGYNQARTGAYVGLLWAQK